MKAEQLKCNRYLNHLQLYYVCLSCLEPCEYSPEVVILNILEQNGHPFLLKTDSNSCEKRTAIPAEFGHGFLRKTDNVSGKVVSICSIPLFTMKIRFFKFEKVKLNTILFSVLA